MPFNLKGRLEGVRRSVNVYKQYPAYDLLHLPRPRATCLDLLSRSSNINMYSRPSVARTGLGPCKLAAYRKTLLTSFIVVNL